MSVSVCITVYNEEETIQELLTSITKQLKNNDEIVVVDGGSTDDTNKILREFSRDNKRINVIFENCSRSVGRNIAVKNAENDIIVMTDAGCIAKENWLKNITKPFNNSDTDVVAGFYEMKADNELQRSMANYLGVLENDFDKNFLPSTRSVAFTKTAWRTVGGFPEELNDTAEDTIFNLRLVKSSMKIVRVKNARVEWGMPDNIMDFAKKIYAYARGDAMSGVWYHDSKKLASHNIKALLVLIRYVIGSIILILSLKINQLLTPLIIGVLVYIIWAFNKNYKKSSSWKVGLWGIIIQISSDLAVIAGLLSGTLKYVSDN